VKIDIMAMIRRRFGWTSVEVPVIGQGTWEIHPESELRAIEALRCGLDLGLTHIDTAESYGRAEELVAEAIVGRRDEVFLVSKVHPANASYDATLRACDQSLKRLKTDWLDLYLLHWRSRHPIEETMRAMEVLVASRQIRFIGVSNFSVSRVRAAQRALHNERLACNQIRYHLGARGIERRLLSYCAEHEIAVVGYSPFAHGNFPSPGSPGGRILAEVGERNHRTPRQVALNFLTRHPGLFTIPKATSIGHVRENAGGAGWTLSEGDITAINHAFPIPSAIEEWMGKAVRRAIRILK
jgi:diketogulonate reductase-like aldo/keto reductase